MFTKKKISCGNVRVSNPSDEIITIDEDIRLRKYCIRKWGGRGEDILHHAYARAIEALKKGKFNQNFLRAGKRRKRSRFYNYVAGILESAREDDLHDSGWRKKIKDGIKKWVEIEIPSTVIKIDDEGKKHGVEEYADPNDQAAVVFYIEKGIPCDLDAEEISSWFVSEINEYTKYLQKMCEYEKLYVLQALCTKKIRLKDVARKRGLSHQNMTKTVSNVHDDLAQRMEIPGDRVQRGIDIIRNEQTLNSRLIISHERF